MLIIWPILLNPFQVRIMKDFDPTGKRGPKIPLPDVVKVLEPKVCRGQHPGGPGGGMRRGLTLMDGWEVGVGESENWYGWI